MIDSVPVLSASWASHSVTPATPVLVVFSGSGETLVLMQEIGKFVAVAGACLFVFGMLLWRFPSLFGWLGKLPGDISVQKGNYSFYFPVVTCILLSIVLTLLSWLFRR
jgi:Protein of unknown function (DUF2905)